MGKSVTRVPMPRSKRAKQFAMFDALKGLKEAIAEKEYLSISKAFLTEDRIAEINDQLLSLKNGQVVTVTYYGEYEKDYLQLTGTVQKIEPYWKYIQIGSIAISFTEILAIEPDKA